MSIRADLEKDDSISIGMFATLFIGSVLCHDQINAKKVVAVMDGFITIIDKLDELDREREGSLMKGRGE